MAKFILSIIVTLFIFSFGISQTYRPAPVTGNYEMGVHVCYNPSTGEISGIISFDNSGQGNGVNISCDQLFTGYHLSSNLSNEFSIKTRYPDDPTNETLSSGKIKIEKGKVFIQIDEPNSCQNLIDLKQGWDFELEKKDDFIACRIIKSPKAYFYSEPDACMRQKAYLVKFDPVCIRKIQNGWLYVAYFNEKGIRNGWIKQQMVYPKIF